MKKSILALTLMLGSFASATTVRTLITCQQDDADQWVEVGIAPNDGPGFRAYVVVHNEDDKTAQLIAERQVFESTRNGETVYEDLAATLRLNLYNSPRSYSGHIHLLQDGSGGLSQSDLVCFKNSTITFDKF